MITKTIAINIRMQRARHGWTKEILARESDLHRNRISLIETGFQDIRLSSLEKIAKALDIDIMDLFQEIKE